MTLPKPTLLLALLSGVIASCASGPPTANPEQTQKITAIFVNPHPAGSYGHFKADPSYPKTYKIYKNEAVLKSGGSPRITIDLGLQRAMLYKGDELAMDYPVSTGKSAYPTPPGNYTVLEKLKSGKASNLYGTSYDAEGNVHNSNADSGDPVPEGGYFKGASMPYWMRLTWSGVGMHRGNVPRYPASHGCIRTYSAAVATVYSNVSIGTPVSIVK